MGTSQTSLPRRTLPVRQALSQRWGPRSSRQDPGLALGWERPDGGPCGPKRRGPPSPGREAGAGSAVLPGTVASPPQGQELARDAPSLRPRSPPPPAFPLVLLVPSARAPSWRGCWVSAGVWLGQLTAKGLGVQRGAPAPAKANRKPSPLH